MVLSALFLAGCQPLSQEDEVEEQPELIIYSGITMVKPLQQLAKEFEETNGVDIIIKQGASGFLYDSLQKERKGDIYFPGTHTYRLKHQSEGLLTDHVFVGYNRIAIIVPKGNPKNLTNDIHQLTNPELSVVLSTPTSGAIGRAGKKMLDKMGLTDAVYDNVTYFTTDSHRLLNAIKEGHADIALNWYATAKWQGSKNIIDVIEIDPSLNPPKRLELNLLSFSEEKVLAREFMDFVSSEQGLEVFYKFGFLTDAELDQALGKTIGQAKSTLPSNPPKDSGETK